MWVSRDDDRVVRNFCQLVGRAPQSRVALQHNDFIIQRLLGKEKKSACQQTIPFLQEKVGIHPGSHPNEVSFLMLR